MNYSLGGLWGGEILPEGDFQREVGRDDVTEKSNID
jgi:hypothetical protein